MREKLRVHILHPFKPSFPFDIVDIIERNVNMHWNALNIKGSWCWVRKLLILIFFSMSISFIIEDKFNQINTNK